MFSHLYDFHNKHQTIKESVYVWQLKCGKKNHKIYDTIAQSNC